MELTRTHKKESEYLLMEMNVLVKFLDKFSQRPLMPWSVDCLARNREQGNITLHYYLKEKLLPVAMPNQECASPSHMVV